MKNALCTEFVADLLRYALASLDIRACLLRQGERFGLISRCLCRACTAHVLPDLASAARIASQFALCV
jgi:hypothetical protein